MLRKLTALKSEGINFRRDFNDLKTKLMDESKRIKDTLLTPAVSFNARQLNDLSLETGQTVVFSKTMANHGDAYDNVTGIFTAPVGGTYVFTIHLCVNGGYTFYYDIIRDSEIQAYGRFYEDGSTACHSANAIMVLEARQKVWLKCLMGSTSSDILSEYDSTSYNYWNTFSGVLIHK
ncbi:C1q-related factor-like [Mercenaria mercenaria]|uniref:C1q-related factor-like n=1 Tax=Mercenaria mercenaria TaxID=6596 RepID=UPI00234FB44F|nr:C1q-related factor-like [Mercenaria mercenaria]